MTSLFLPPWLQWPESRAIIAALGAEAARFVGGVVRDGLLGLDGSDIDIATTILPAEVMARLSAKGMKVIPTGIDHGTVTVVASDRVFEVTTLRRDVATDGRRAVIAHTTDWQEDAARRDFTINALYLNSDGHVFDYFGGQADLANGHVRFIGDAETRIAEDALRILRFFRFYARFGKGAPDAAGLAACVARAKDLMTLSRERVRDELLKLLSGPNPVPVVQLMLDHGLLKAVIPEIDGTDRLAQLVAREDRHAAGSDLRRLAALLPRDAGVLDHVGNGLRLSRKQVSRLVSMADTPLADLTNAIAARAYLYQHGAEALVDTVLLGAMPEPQLALVLALCQDWTPPRLPVTGKHFIQRGMLPGPAVAKAVQAFAQLWIAEEFPEDMSKINDLIDIALKQVQLSA
jgi:poly(A) polymerase